MAQKRLTIRQLAWFFINFFLFIGACDRLPQGNQQNKFAEAANALNSKDFQRAIRIYESLLASPNDAAEAHYHLAVLYESHSKDPIAALHHYQRYLKLAPSPKNSREIQRSIERLEQEVAMRLSEGGLISRQEAIRIRNENNQLRKEITQLREQLAAEKRNISRLEQLSKTKNLIDKSGFSKVPQTREAERNVGAETRTYTVQKGDTLASISRKFYNTPARWKDIADANFNQLQGSTNLREGQILIIP